MARFELNYNNNKLKERRRNLRNNSTKAEVLLWEHLRKNQILGFKFRRQFSIGTYIVDFYCTELMLAIEIDGITHLKDEEKEYDQYRQTSLENVEISFLRYTNEDIFNKLSWVLETIKNKVKELSKT